MATDSEPQAQQQLSFPPLQFAKLSPRPFLHAHLSRPDPIRPNGRSPNSHRKSAIHTSALSNTAGSAVVRHGNTSCVAGVTAEILSAEDVGAYRISDASNSGPTTGARTSSSPSDADEIAKLTLLVPNIELNTGCNPAFLPGGPPSTLAQSLSHRLLTLTRISDLVSFEDLKIWHRPERISKGSSNTRDDDAMDVEDEADDEVQDEVKGFWVLYIDIVFISLDGSAFDVAWLALLAALQSTKLPLAKWDADLEQILCSPLEEDQRSLTLKSFPVPLTACVFSYDASGLIGADGVSRGNGEQSWILEDADDFEESCCEESVTVVVHGERVLRVERGGGVAVEVDDVKMLCGRAKERWGEWKRLLEGKVQGGGLPGSLGKK